MMMNEKFYLKCRAKEKIFENGGSVLNVAIKSEELIEFVRKHTNETGYLHLNISKRKEIGQYGDTHSISLYTWKSV